MKRMIQLRKISTNEFEISLSNIDEVKSVIITDMLGRSYPVDYSTNDNRILFESNDLIEGIYIINVILENNKRESVKCCILK